MARALIDWLRWFFWNRRTKALPVYIERRKPPLVNCKEATRIMSDAADRLYNAISDKMK